MKFGKVLIICGGLLATTSCTSDQVQQTIAEGQLVCKTATGLVAVVNAVSNSPVLVTGQLASTVANICATLNAIPVPPPASGKAPTVAVTVTS